MRIEKRRNARRDFHYPAKLDFRDGSPPRDCLLWDISKTGAKITIQKPDDLPEYVTLLLSDIGNAERRCQVVWRSELQVGVKFVNDFPKTASDSPQETVAGEVCQRNG